MDKYFLMDRDSELNQILNKLTGLENLVSSYDLSMNASGKYVCDKGAAERKVSDRALIIPNGQSRKSHSVAHFKYQNVYKKPTCIESEKNFMCWTNIMNLNRNTNTIDAVLY